ncbi:MAG: autotransporter outer membrane beta-barrel domain-containing protein [Alphaproteobacteria bacterium]|nr:autotransporter outer membrane beta-barrel domain-containing protein [Alphaproteobacteria bacterium]
MRLTRTTLKELTRKYRAVLRHCAMALVATMCVVNNAIADDITAYTNAENVGGKYTGDGTKEIIIAESSSGGLSQGLTSSDTVYGQYKAEDNLQYNTVRMFSGTVGSIYGASCGGISYSGIKYNIVSISGGTIKGEVYGGEGFTADYNKVIISGSPFFDSGSKIYGGSGMGVNNNIVSIFGTPIFNSTEINGKIGMAGSNNTLILNTKVSGISSAGNFQNYIFVLTNNVSNGDTMLSVDSANPVDLDGTKVAVGAVSGSTLNVGDHVVLINNVTGTPTLDMSLFNDTNISKYAYTISTNYTFSINVENDQLIALLDSKIAETSIKEEVVNGLFSGTKNAVNSTNEAVKSSIRARLSQLSGVPTSSSSASSKKGQSGGDEDAKYGLWAQALYNHIKRDSSASAVGFKGHSEGVVMGADTEVTDGVIAGVAYSYTKSEMKSVGEKTDVKTHGFFAYGQYKPNEYFVNGSLGFGISKAEPKNGDDDVKSKFYSFDALTGFEKATDVGVFVPGVGFRYVRINQDAYKDGDTRLKAKDSNTVTAVVQLGWNNAYKVNTMEITPRATLGFIYDIKSDDNKVNVKAGNVHILTEDDRLSRFGTELNVGVDTKVNNQWGLSLDYNGEYRQHYKNHTGTVSVRYDF